MNNDLFLPFTLGAYTLPNRIVMAPMTRSRAGDGDAPSHLAASYYAQRATAGLIITEASQVSAQAKGYPKTPGIFTDVQVANWCAVTDAVHAQGGRIFLQLWHVGRVSLTNLQELGTVPVGPSAIRAAGKTFTGGEYTTPRALDLNEMPGIVQQYVDGSQHAKAAGFDGVEIHGANGYLLDQFLRDGTNKREDAYGGTVANRARLLLETTEAVNGVWGKERVGVRLSPLSDFNDMHDSDPVETFVYAAQELSKLGIAYLHVMNPTNSVQPLVVPDPNAITSKMRVAFQGPFMLNGGYDKDTGGTAIGSGAADLISFSMPFIANPDLVRRYAENAPLNAPDPSTMYSGDAHGYTDYPTLA
jgi:N-ethylmaleimide reductase